MNIRNFVQQIGLDYAGIEEQKILNKSKHVVGWHSHVMNKAGQPLGGGTSQDILTARRVAIAEFIERGLVKKLKENRSDVDRFKLDSIPTTSGFAAGFELAGVRFRSICEGLERWAWSQWIDHGYLLPEIRLPLLTPLAKQLVKPFELLKAYQTGFNCELTGINFQLVFSVLLGVTEKGVFAGSRVTSAYDEPWTHSATEVWRNYRNFLWLQKSEYLPETEDWFLKRIQYFGQNKAVAFDLIGAAKNESWPQPQIDLFLGFEPLPGVYLWRTLFQDFVPWHLGPESRFVY